MLTLKHYFSLESSRQKVLVPNLIFKKLPKRKQSPNGRKFSQAGHPDYPQHAREFLVTRKLLFIMQQLSLHVTFLAIHSKVVKTFEFCPFPPQSSNLE
jgi:hypothetical protein